MSSHQMIPGLDYEFCQTCRVWIPTKYQIQIFHSAYKQSTQAIADFVQLNKKKKIPKSLKKKRDQCKMDYEQALKELRDH